MSATVSESAGLSVLVISCDRYADLWRPFFELFWRHWPDCQGPVYLGSNFTDYSDPRVQTIKVNTIFLPNRSPSLPKSGVAIVCASRYAVMTHES